MAREIVTFRVSFAWWWTWLYWPLTRFGLHVGLPLDAGRIFDDCEKAIRLTEVEAEPDRD